MRETGERRIFLPDAGDETAVYLGYSQVELDRAYAQREWASNADAILARWNSRGAACRSTRYGYSEHAYGTGCDERIDLFEADGDIVHFHLHGGAWRGQAKEDCSFMAPAMQDAGVTFVVPEFGRLPRTRMPAVLDQIVRALVWTYETRIATGRAEGIVVSGHSSGAHMAALLASHDFRGRLPPGCLRAVLCVSGAYDLRPVMLSARRTYIDLAPAEVRQMSPILRTGDLHLPVHLMSGSDESPEFCRQSRAYATSLGLAGRLAGCHELPGRNHFEIADDLGDPGSAAGQYVRALLSMPNRLSDLPPGTEAHPPLRSAAGR